MALLEAARKAGRFVRDAATRARYSDETLRLIRPFMQDKAVDADWASRFEYGLLRGKRESFVSAACNILTPPQRAKLFFVLADTLDGDDFQPKDPNGNRNLIQDIWVRGNERESVTREIVKLDEAEETRQKVLRFIRGV